ncbi:hypothetical protein ACFYO2_25525 [Streptomyces sp. NPDC006602]|uniref:hypothetical protein n=1 Tax=Streptomyces sp. NPDC006602 TaxID=3364751 RepID=UPI00367A264A
MRQPVSRETTTVVRDLSPTVSTSEYDVMNLPREARARTIEPLGREVALVQQLFTKEPTHV